MQIILPLYLQGPVGPGPMRAQGAHKGLAHKAPAHKGPQRPIGAHKGLAHKGPAHKSPTRTPPTRAQPTSAHKGLGGPTRARAQALQGARGARKRPEGPEGYPSTPPGGGFAAITPPYLQV